MLSNVRSLLKKIDEVQLIAETKNPALICLTETWLHSDIPSAIMKIPGYEIFRGDRLQRKGGGTAIFVRSNLTALPILLPAGFPGEVDVIAVALNDIIIVCLYVPPDSSAMVKNQTHDALCLSIDSLITSSPHFEHTIIVGDFNRFGTQQLCQELDLTDLIIAPTRQNNVLDHVLISNSLLSTYDNTSVTYNAPIGTSDHLTIMVTPTSSATQVINNSRVAILRDYRRSNMFRLFTAVSKLNWDELYSESDVNKQWEIFHNAITSAINENIPQQRVLMKDNDKAWMTPLTKFLINEKWHAFHDRDWSRYNHLKYKLKTEICRAKKIWASKSKDSSKALWKTVKQMTGSSKQENDLKPLIQNCQGIDCLLDTLVTMFATPSTVPMAVKIDGVEDWSIAFTEQDVYRHLKQLKSNKSGGSDLIPNKIYSHLADAITSPLTHIFCSSIEQRVFPVSWKTGIVCPIPKTRPPKLQELRQITLLPAPAKILERIVLKTMWPLFNHSYGNNQHGFRPRASTSTALIEILDEVYRHYDDTSKFGAAVISFDMSKAFDCIDHGTLMQKLEPSFPKGFLEWLHNYLINRTSRIKMEGRLSAPFDVTRGVPQGSVLGPPLFCSYVGDVACKNVKAKLVKYADDVNVIVPLPTDSEADIITAINTEVENFQQWCSKNHLRLNTRKTKVMFFTRRPLSLNGKLLIPQTPKLTILGVTINESLDWKDHVQNLCSKVNKQFYAMRKVRRFLTPMDLHTVYEATIRNLLEYACPVFVGLPPTLSERLNRVVRRAHRIIANNQDFECHCEDLKSRRNKFALKLLSKAEKDSGHVLHALIPHRLKRSGHLRMPYCRTEKRQQSFIPFVTLLANQNFYVIDE